MLPILHIGPLAIQFPGLVLLLGLWLGLSLAERFVGSHPQRYSCANSEVTPPAPVPAPILYNLAVGSLIAAIIGARLFYILQYTQVFIDDPTSMISLNTSLLDVRGAILGAILFALYYGQRKRLQFWHTLDALTPALAVLAIFIHLSNLASGSGFGSPTQAAWGIHLWGANRHPVQVYEAGIAILILFLLWPAKTRFTLTRPGEYFLVFIALSAASRLLLEAFHGDSPLLFSGFRLWQVIAWFTLAFSFYLLHHLEQKSQGMAPQDQITAEKGSISDHG
jgi:prolipoprotein diacylglyceryltransferase